MEECNEQSMLDAWESVWLDVHWRNSLELIGCVGLQYVAGGGNKLHDSSTLKVWLLQWV